MPESFIPYGRQTITEEDISAVVETLRSPFLTQGPAVPAFERELSRVCGCNHSVAFNSATSALHASCLALGLGPGDRLWTSPVSFVASANCALYCGAEVDFVDIESNTGLMDIVNLKQKLREAKQKGKLPKILVPVHLAGTSCPMREIAELADEYGFKILEDASHAVGASYGGSPVGSCQFSSITVFSFHPVKIITTGEGGASLTNDPVLRNRLESIRCHGINRNNFESESPGPWYYEQQSIGYNYRLTDMQASLGLSQIKRLPTIINRRRELARRYRDKLSESSASLLKEPNNCESSYHLAILRIPHATPNQHRLIFEDMRNEGIGVQLHYWPIPLQPYYRKLGFSEGQFPKAEQYALTCFSMPLFPDMSNNDQDRVIHALHKLLNKHGLSRSLEEN
ncbi:UDP-4-amino-4,6-dideoxy-N-acetyl-beta-L-altrosamine transaminase [Synechococcus sp. MU1611]|uniref:UDP-4-amino-4, 6-dideoxy-N-acetyl-beta-L-altrosamine transaminase n=1 Tax=Synechococcus sp. MU1611 TaxID=2508345 RepID=UPI001CF8B88D|nr:UDP-4-amino-4,6-dideoxy-N-acetyl-beta-L-altrosamine transaminase [Synechococcus sp. MU1611]MCB4412106.1 UDP-4-amino-4,6-dideoxy-N-acetyl-beta-L-altrosamine transaminase [Synechococcus sp. MU1611]